MIASVACKQPMRIAAPSRAAKESRESGFTLAEVLVAVTVMAILFVVAFSLYDSLQKSFKMNENAATEQQNTRVAFDRMVADVRMAGFNVNPDGVGARPDEQIEGMWDTVITVRGDYDFEDASAKTTPESTLGGSSALFKTVSTGNDEIVTYALSKPNWTGGSTVSFIADVTGVPRDGTQETVTIGNVALTQDAPPYTLYRYTVSANSTTVVKQPVADNIKTMNFIYYSGAVDPNSGAPITLTSVGGGESATDLAARKGIARVNIAVVGMTEDPDLAYIDPTDASSPTRHYRKFTLASDVTPRNLGMVGVVDIDLDDPNAPENFTACQGHCNGTYLKWDSGGDPDIGSYTVSWGTSTGSLTNVVSTNDENHYISGITGAHYYAVRSVDLVGNQSGNVIVGPSTPNDTTTPGQVAAASSTGDAGAVIAALDDQIAMTWSPPTGNTVNLSCDESPYPIRDLAGYRVYKGATVSFDPNISSQVLQSWDPNTLGATTGSLADTNVVNCRQYFYKVRAEDQCAKQGAISPVIDGSSTASARPAAPTTVSATDMGHDMHEVTWNRVTQNSAASPSNILIDKYKVLRAVVASGDDPNQATYTQVFNGLVSNPTSPLFSDPNVPNITGYQSYYYRVAALDDCAGNDGLLSPPDEAEHCNFGGSVSLSISPGGSSVMGNQAITISVSGPPVQSTQIIVKNASTGAVVYSATDSTAPYVYAWNASSGTTSGQAYTIDAWVTNTSGCTESASTTVTVNTAIACCISTNNPNLSPTTGSLKNNEVFFGIINNCGEDVQIDKMNILFTNNAGQGAQLDQFDYNIFDSLASGRDVNLSPNANSIVPLDFTISPLAPSLVLKKGNDAMSPVRLSYLFTKPMLNRAGSIFIGESIRTDFLFTVASQSGAGRCDITVVTNPLSLVSCDPSNDPNCGL